MRNLSFNEIIKRASPSWMSFSFEEKEKYKNRAKFINERDNPTPDTLQQTQTSHKTQTSSKPLLTPQETAKQKKLREQTMLKEVEELVQNAFDTKSKKLKIFINFCANIWYLSALFSKIYCFISGSSFYDDIDDIYPAEFAMALYNLDDGVISNLQIEINPGIIPSVGTYDAIINSRKIKYPVPKSDDNKDSYYDILCKILKFLRPVNKFPLIFFTDGDMKHYEDDFLKNERILKKFLLECGEYYVAHEIKVYPVSFLLYYMRKYALLAQGVPEMEDAVFKTEEDARNSLQIVSYETEYFVVSTIVNFNDQFINVFFP